MKKNKKGEKTTYIITVIIAIILLSMLLIFVNVQHKNASDKNTTSKIRTTTKKILKDKLTIDDKEIDIEVDEYKTPWGVTVKYEPLYFKVGADDKIMKFTSIIDKNTYLVIEKMTESEYRKSYDLKKTEEDGNYVLITRVIKNGQAYLKTIKCHKKGIEYDEIDIRMEYILKQLN
ncbi:MAG: hypothetical protein OSJ70_00115 [Bacilli bacterium]|nr:hypothetical protein [Bacilli bacterium]